MATRRTQNPAQFSPLPSSTERRGRRIAQGQAEAAIWQGRGLKVGRDGRTQVSPARGIAVTADLAARSVRLSQSLDIADYNVLVGEYNALREDLIELKGKYDQLVRAMIDAEIGER